ncbi:MAG: hypothetical protein QOD88_4239, partial [Mycobacterium sp.]|nr:hypothetical protein [Mycobacterium sp.]
VCVASLIGIAQLMRVRKKLVAL